MHIMVLNDGETFTNLDGCFIVHVPDDATHESDVIEQAIGMVGYVDDDYLAGLEATFEVNGGRGVELADEIDLMRLAKSMSIVTIFRDPKD